MTKKPNPFTQKARSSTVLRPFGSSIQRQRASSTPEKDFDTSVKPRMSRSEKQKARQTVTPASHGNLTYLLTLGYGTRKYNGDWVIVDRFGIIQADEPVHESPTGAQKRADEMNSEVMEMRTKELAKW